jgi:hypothetical protein
MTCVKCSSENSIDGVRIIYRYGQYGLQKADIAAVAHRDPDALLFKGEVATPIVGRVCGDCGYVELYVVEPGALLEVAKHLAEPVLEP